jgi:hypothetical protein
MQTPEKVTVQAEPTGLVFANHPELCQQSGDLSDTGNARGAIMLMAALFLILAILGVWLLASTLLQQREARLSLTWPSTGGVVSKHQIEKEIQESDNGPDTVSYEPVVTYSYRVGDRTYTSTRISSAAPWGYSFGSPEDAAKFLEQYPLGKRLTVYYNPDQPKRALLDRSAPGDLTLVYVFGWGLIGLLPLGLFIVVMWGRSFCRTQGCPDDWKHWSFWRAQVSFQKQTG